jgi:outer membrane protein
MVEFNSMKKFYIMKMQHTKILKFLTLFVLISFLYAPSFGEAPETFLCNIGNPETSKILCENEGQGPVTLQETLERTYMQNATLDAARAGLRATDETVSQANADWRPSLSVEGTQSYQQTNPIHSHGLRRRSHQGSTGYVAQITQNIYKGGATEAQIGVAESNVFGEKAGLFSTEQQVLLSAISAHASVIANQDIVKYLQDSVSFYKQFYDRTQAQFEVGMVGRPDVEAALAGYEEAKANLSSAFGELEASKAEYFQIVASPPENLMPADILLELPETYQEVLNMAQQNNPQITQESYAVEAARYNVELQTSGLLPVLGVVGTVGNDRRFGTGLSDHPKDTSLGARAVLDVPIYKQGLPSSQIRQAYQTLAQRKVNLVQAQRVVEQSARTAWEQLIAAREALKGYMAQVKAQEIAVEGKMEEVNVGAATIVDVLFLQKDLIQAQIALVNAEKNLITTTYAVLQAMGSLMACSLKLNVKYYDPDEYYNEYKNAWIQFWQGEDLRYVKDEPCGPICR